MKKKVVVPFYGAGLFFPCDIYRNETNSEPQNNTTLLCTLNTTYYYYYYYYYITISSGMRERENLNATFLGITIYIYVTCTT